MCQDYRCRKCGLQFNHYEITAEDDEENNLCPACLKPLDEFDIIRDRYEED